MGTKNLPAPRRESLPDRVERSVHLPGLNKAALDELVGFETHPNARIECRTSDNLLKAAMYFARGYDQKAKEVEKMGGAYTPPSQGEILERLVCDRLVRQRMRELVAQANLTKQQVVPVRLSDGPEHETARGIMEYLISHLDRGFDSGQAPAAMPRLKAEYLGKGKPVPAEGGDTRA